MIYRAKFRFYSFFLMLLLFLILNSEFAFSTEVVSRFDVKIPARDGVLLSADMYMPVEPGHYPAILIRTPYLKTNIEPAVPGLVKYFAARGYVVLIQDVRGRGDSQGEFIFYSNEGKDGYDTIEWIAQQPWCNGKVGMMGVSYLGAVQWLAARERPPHLVCIVPTAPSGLYFEEIPYKGGAFMMEWALPWINGVSGRLQQSNPPGPDMEKVHQHRPLRTMDEFMGRNMKIYKNFLNHSTFDDYWKNITFSKEDFAKIDIPALTVSGWFDDDQAGALYYWDGMNEYSGVKDRQFLRIGPWTHNQTFMGGQTKIGEMEFSEDSIMDVRQVHLNFFDHYLKGKPLEEFPKVRVFVTGSNKWNNFEEYPPRSATQMKYYLHSGGKANTLIGDGTLNTIPPSEEKVDNYIYDPKNPVSISMGDLAADNRLNETRKDVLVYTGEKLKNPVEIIGPVSMVLYTSSDAKDTDFMAHLIDVYPDGKAINLGCEAVSIVRARYRNGYEKEILLTPGKPEKFVIKLHHIGHTFLPGHRIRIAVTSSAYPMANPNQNTGNPVATDMEWHAAKQNIYHDKMRPSHISLPVMGKK